MLTTVRELREHIRKQLLEMPLMDVLPLHDPTKGQKQPDEHNASRQAAQKFFDNDHFKEVAIKLYKNLSIPVYIVPSWTANRFENRIKNLSLDELQAQHGVSDDNIEKLREELASGATVWVAQSNKLMKNRLPTPWMIVHAMIDSEGGSTIKVWRRLREVCEEIFPDERNDYFPQASKKIASALTMKSARDGHITFAITDICAEICTQAVLDSRGFHFNEVEDPKVLAFCEAAKRLTSTTRREFEAAVSGRILEISVSPF